MDIPTIVDYAHKNAYPFIAGAIATRPILCADLAFKLVMKTPLKYIFIMNYPTISSWIDAFQAEMAKKVAEQKPEVPAA